MKRIEFHLTDDEAVKLEAISKQDGRKRKQFVENEIRKIITEKTSGSNRLKDTSKTCTSNVVNREYLNSELVCSKCGGIKVCEWCIPFNQPIPPKGIVL